MLRLSGAWSGGVCTGCTGLTSFQWSITASGVSSGGVGCKGVEDFMLMLSSDASGGVGSSFLMPDKGVQLLASVESHLPGVCPSV